MKTILVPHVDAEGLEPILECALRVARRFGSYVEGLRLRRMMPTVVSEAGGMMLAMVETVEEEERSRAEAAQKAFRAVLREAGVSLGAKAPAKASAKKPAKSGKPVTAAWREAEERGDDAGGYARLFDLVVCGRPDETPAAPPMGAFETILFEGGRPVLIVPAASGAGGAGEDKAPSTLGRAIVIAWNGSTESARAIAFARPFLEAAGTVTVLSVEDGMVRGPDSAAVADALTRGGVKATAMHIAADHRPIGEAILEESAKLGADLLIKGAYTHSRLRQMIFGGPTSHIIAHAQVPVLMAH